MRKCQNCGHVMLGKPARCAECQAILLADDDSDTDFDDNDIEPDYEVLEDWPEYGDVEEEDDDDWEDDWVSDDGVAEDLLSDDDPLLDGVSDDALFADETPGEETLANDVLDRLLTEDEPQFENPPIEDTSEDTLIFDDPLANLSDFVVSQSEQEAEVEAPPEAALDEDVDEADADERDIPRPQTEQIVIEDFELETSALDIDDLLEKDTWQEWGGGLKLVLEDDSLTLQLKPDVEVTVGLSDPRFDYVPDVDLRPYGGKQKGVSRRHALLMRQGGRLIVADQDSTNGTWLSGKKLRAAQWRIVKDGDLLRLAGMVITVKLT